MAYFATMIERFPARGEKKKKIVVVCKTLDEAKSIERYALSKGQYTHVFITLRKPRHNMNLTLVWRYFHLIDDNWKK